MSLRMVKWTPEKEELIKKRLGGWTLKTTGPREAYILSLEKEDILHIHVDGEVFIALPRNAMRKYQPE